MFRLLRLKPPHGWNAVAWELAIVTLGVIIALAAQQWAEGRSARNRLEATKGALRAELGEHYNFAVEFRTVYPCIQAQLAGLRKRVLASGTSMNPAPIYHEPDLSDDFVIRFPSKPYSTDAWDAAIAEGQIQRFDPDFWRPLGGHYAQLKLIESKRWANDEAEQGLVVLSHPIPLDPEVRYAILKEIDQLGGRMESLDILNGQVLDHIENADMVPPVGQARSVTQRYGTYRFCKQHHLSMRSFKDAMISIPN